MITEVFTQINNAVLDIQASDVQTFGRPFKALARLLQSSELTEVNSKLVAGLDLDHFLNESAKTRGGMLGSSRLAWPDNHDEQLGLTLLLVQKLGENPDQAIHFCHEYFYSGSKIISGIHGMVRQLIIPFARDYKIYVERESQKVDPAQDLTANVATIEEKGRGVVIRTPLNSNKVFIVHGHDGEVKVTVARFIEKLGLEAIILHERPNRGRTIISKFREEAAGTGFAVVLMTPDDVGRSAQSGDEQLRQRARQNVVFELGFFIGEFGLDRVAALVKGDVEKPSDFDGVVYIAMDSGNWEMQLGKELVAAGYSIDWYRVMT